MKDFKLKFPILFDGAMGTYYRELSNNRLPECEMANIFDSETVKNIHKEYIKVGIDAIKTNTFGANTKSLNCSKEIRDQIIKNGCDIAKKAIEESERKDILIFGDIGPISFVEQEDKEAVKEYVDIVDKFFENGVKLFLFETLDEVDILLDVFDYIKKRDSDSYIIASFAINPDGYSRKGYSGQELLDKCYKSKNVDSVGFNCISGPGYMLNTLKGVRLPDMPISVMPNASYPTVVNNRIYYSDNPSYFADTCMEYVDIGVRIFGGCCGTTPKHIEKMREALDKRIIELSEKKDIMIYDNVDFSKIDSIKVISSNKLENKFYKKLCSPKKVLAVEIDPPADVNIEKYIKNVARLKECGIDAITIADCPVGRARVDSSLMAFKLKNEVGIEPIVHLTCRDRNLNATKALILGLNIENIRNVLVVTGDPIPNAEKDEIKPVFNFNSRLLAKYISELNEKVFSSEMTITSGLNINSRNFDIELKKAKKKEECGVVAFFTQPVSSEEAILNLKKAKKELKSKIIGGIIPVVSYRNAVFMNEEISGIKVDEKIVEMYKDIDKEEAKNLAVELSVDFMEKIKDIVDGYYLITPFSRVDIIESIINKTKHIMK